MQTLAIFSPIISRFCLTTLIFCLKTTTIALELPLPVFATDPPSPLKQGADEQSSPVIVGGRLQGVAVKGRLVCAGVPLVGAKVKIVDIDPRPDRDDLMGEVKTDANGFFHVFGATREATNIDVMLKIYHDCLDDDGFGEDLPCQKRVKWFVPSKYHNNGTIGEWFDIGTINMELRFPQEERDCRH